MRYGLTLRIMHKIVDVTEYVYQILYTTAIINTIMYSYCKSYLPVIYIPK